jgi:hypothetical protein
LNFNSIGERTMRYFLMALVVGLAGCVTEQGTQRLVEFAAEVSRDAVPESSPLFESVSIGEIHGGREGSASSAETARDEDFTRALTTALSDRGMLAVEPSRYTLHARIVRSDYPFMAMSLIEVTTEVEYTMVDNASGETVFKRVVTVMESTGFRESPIFATRIALSTVKSLASNATNAVDQIVAALGAPTEPAEPAETPEALEPPA